MQKRLILICTALLLSACAGFEFPGVYKIDIQQGNIIEAEQVEQLKLGMTEDQVRYLLGTPLVTDTFHPHRWDYFYSLKTGEGDYQRERLTLVFDNRILASIKRGEPVNTDTAAVDKTIGSQTAEPTEEKAQ